eukprot:scaffold25058_cov138-Isochrysis_galbana.AAC.1
MQRLPISSIIAPPPRAAPVVAMKSAERLFNAACTRAPRRLTNAPSIPAEARREVLRYATPARRNNLCFGTAPADAWSVLRNQKAYSVAARPTPPAAACNNNAAVSRSRICRAPTCTVPHVLISVAAASHEIDGGLLTWKQPLARAHDAKHAEAHPKDRLPTEICFTDAPRASTSPAQSVPGSDIYFSGSWFSTRRTSRKLRPTAWTRSSTCHVSSGSTKSACASMHRSDMAPLRGTLRRTPDASMCKGATSRPTCSDGPRTTASTSTDGERCRPCTLPMGSSSLCRATSFATRPKPSHPSRSRQKTGRRIS